MIMFAINNNFSLFIFFFCFIKDIKKKKNIFENHLPLSDDTSNDNCFIDLYLYPDEIKLLTFHQCTLNLDLAG